MSTVCQQIHELSTPSSAYTCITISRCCQQHAASDDIVSFAIGWCAGLDATRHTWDIFINKISGRFNALALDQRGWGESPLGREEEYSAAAVAADIEAAMQEDFGTRKVVLVGHSMGGKIAMKLTADYPDR